MTDKLIDEYRWLLLKRDELEREASELDLLYTQTFGNYAAEVFRLNIECIKVKKSISYCVKAMNNSETVSAEELNQYLIKHMSVYQKQLDKMLEKNEKAKKAETVSSFTAEQVRKTYRRIAKLIHPDICPIKNDKALDDYFLETQKAYYSNDLKRIKELEVLVNAYLKELGIDVNEIEIPDIQQKIEELEEEINELMSGEMDSLKELLYNDDKKSEKINQFKDEIETKKKYLSELENKLKEIVAEMNKNG